MAATATVPPVNTAPPSTSSMMQILNRALGTPEVGAVNFNELYVLLHTVLVKLDMQDVKVEVDPEVKEFLSAQKPDDTDADGFSDKDSAITGLTVDTDRPQTSSGKKDKGKQDVVKFKSSPYHELENKVHKLQEQIDRYNSLPSNDELKQLIAQGDGEKPRPVNDMWQALQLKNRVDTNEGGINKLMSLVEDLMNDVEKLKNDNAELQKQVDKNNPDDLLNQLKKLEDAMNALKEQQEELAATLDQYPDPEVFSDLVTWQGLEDALRGMRDELEPKEQVVIEAAQQTTPLASRAPSRASTPGPSIELLDILERLGILTSRFDKLEGRVDDLEDLLKQKADKDALEGLGDIPSDLLERLNAMAANIDDLRDLKDRDSEALGRMHQSLLNLQSELERVSKQCQYLIDENGNRIRDIDGLMQVTTELEDTKADKDMIFAALDVKADKKQLETKVNRSLFDETCDELNKMIKDLLSKLALCEDEWKAAFDQLTQDMDGKLDRLEFGPIKDEIERQLRALMRKINSLATHGEAVDDDAAGIRKQLIQRFHCISCDRPVDMIPQGAMPSIPQSQGLPVNRSARPYTTYELDQIRQHAKSTEGSGFPPLHLSQPPTSVAEATELFNNRACGGSHTMTYPHRRITRSTHINNLFREEDFTPQTQVQKEEQDIQGADGHIYKGRTDRLPNLAQSKSSPKLGRRARTDMGGQSHEPAPPMSPRPVSARNPMSRPNTAGDLVPPQQPATNQPSNPRMQQMTEGYYGDAQPPAEGEATMAQ